MNYGFVRVGAAVPSLKVADCIYNSEQIIDLLNKAEELGIQIITFPELSITGYTCGDLFQQRALLRSAEAQLSIILDSTKDLEVIGIVGMPIIFENKSYNCAVVIQKGVILGITPKTLIPNYSEFYEKRWFASGINSTGKMLKICNAEVPFGVDLLFKDARKNEVCFGVEICEDLWAPISPSCYMSMAGATLIFNLSASNEIVGKYEYRKQLIQQHSAKNTVGYVYASSGIGESTTDLVFGGHAIIAEYGNIIAESERFMQDSQIIYSEVDVEKLISDRSKNTSFVDVENTKSYREVIFKLSKKELTNITRVYERHPFVPEDLSIRDKRCEEILAIQTAGLMKRLAATGIKNVVLGISGGLDSTLALLVVVKAFDKLSIPRKNIIAVTMPGFGTTDKTYVNALTLINYMGATLKEIDIKPACLQHFNDIGHDKAIHDVTYENVQARERTSILMNIANKLNGLVIGTGDLSELALGWCTYNGDHMSMYSVNCSIPKTLVKFLVKWVAENSEDKKTKEVLLSIVDTPITPELLPPDKTGKIQQKTEDIVGPYELHDFFMYHMLRYGASPSKIKLLVMLAFKGEYTNVEINKWLTLLYKRFFSQQFKRSCMPDGPKVGTISLSPRGDWRMPSDATANIWLKELEE